MFRLKELKGFYITSLFLWFRFAMKTNTHIRRSANTRITKNVMKNTKRSAITMMWRSLITKRSRFPRQFVIMKSTTVILDIVLTQTFIPDTLDSVPQAITSDTTLGTTLGTTLDTTLVTTQDTMAVAMAVATAALDTTLDTTQDTVALAVSILADRFVLICHICFRIHNWISTIYLIYVSY